QRTDTVLLRQFFSGHSLRSRVADSPYIFLTQFSSGMFLAIQARPMTRPIGMVPAVSVPAQVCHTIIPGVSVVMSNLNLAPLWRRQKCLRNKTGYQEQFANPVRPKAYYFVPTSMFPRFQYTRWRPAPTTNATVIRDLIMWETANTAPALDDHGKSCRNIEAK